MSLDAQSRRLIVTIVAKHGFRDAAIFGSVARGEDKPASDIDILVTPGPATSLLDQVACQDALQEALGRPVQLVSRNGIKPWARAEILAEAIPV